MANLPAGFELVSTVPEGFELVEPQGVADTLTGAAQLAGAGVVGAGKQAIEGLSGLGGLVAGRSVEESVGAAQALTAQIPDVEVGPEGQALLDTISEKFQAAPEFVKEIFNAVSTLGPSIGESAFQATGSPLAGALAGAIPGALEAATPLAGARAVARGLPGSFEAPEQTGVDIPPAGFPDEQGATLPELPVSTSQVISPTVTGLPPNAPQRAKDLAQGIFDFQTPEKKRIGELIESGATDIDTAKFVLERGRIVKDKKAVEAIKQGFDEGSIAVIKASPSADRTSFKKMVDIMEKAKGNLRFATENRPSDVPGKSLSERLDFIDRSNIVASKQIDRIARQQLKNKPVPFEQAQNRFFKQIEQLGVTIDEKGLPNFEQSDIQGLTGAENIIKKIIRRMDRPGVPDGLEIHKVKRFIDTQIKFGRSQESLADEGLRIARELRFDFNKSLQETFPEYAVVNKKFSDTREALDNFEEIAGTKLPIGSPNFDKFAGTLLRRVSGNAVSRIPLMNSVAEIENVTRSLGKTFDGDVITQMLFSDELDEVFGSVARKSFGGEIGSEIRRGAQLIVSPQQAIVEGVAAVADKARGIDQKGAFRAIKALLDE